MKIVGSTVNKRAFQQLWRFSGSPKLRLIQPITAWTLPSGVRYDGNLDRFVGVNGQTVVVDWQAQPYLEVGFLPSPQNNDVTLALPGVTIVARTPVTLLWSEATEAAVRTAWGVSLSAKLYRIDKFALVPLGVAIPNSIDLELIEARK
jgi:hypothetical protein